MAENDTIQSQDEVVATLSHVDEYLKIGQEYDCSDIHLATNAKPTWRRYGTLQSIWENGATLTAADTERLVFGFLGEKEKARLADKGDVDFAYQNRGFYMKTSILLGKNNVFIRKCSYWSVDL